MAVFRAFPRVVLCLAIGWINAVPVAQAQQKSPAGEIRYEENASLLSVWLSMPAASTVDWNYAFISTEGVSASREAQRSALIGELNRITAAQAADADPDSGLRDWKSRLSALHVFRVPGNWGPAKLMAKPREMPNLAALSAIGVCDAAGFIEVWDVAGVRRIDWHDATMLSDLLREGRIVMAPGVQRVTVISPTGQRQDVGVAAWNQADIAVTPGARVVVPARLDGVATEWLNRALPDFLAHVASGVNCKRWNLGSAE